ncbi:MULTISPECIES: phage repressor protein CI [Kosakonia]|uniref:phage repressor protein CI n=1 Tax=Kosakonia TaxID=1330547 RepID=UPI0005EFD9C7|nr:MULTISPECIES: phage repressor protein CI [Kosakonia]RCX06248.1 bacteriophage CI repressor-like protein [Kosakonia sp. AG348]
MDFNSGGKKVIERLVEAYGFTTRQALCDHLGVSKSTMATRYMRDIFPADWIIQCAIETGYSLQWLSFGVGDRTSATAPISLNKKILTGNKLENAGIILFDRSLLNFNYRELIFIIDNSIGYICETIPETISDGKWLISIDDQQSIRNITRIPGNKLKVEGNDSCFECNIDELSLIGLVVKTIL